MCLIYLFHDQFNWKQDEPKGPRRPMVELTDEQLDQVVGQAGIQFINEYFDIYFSPDEVTSFADLNNQMISVS